MSPMIDMVFLLLIFFMVTSRLIVIRQDKSVEPSVALESKPLAEARGRVVINLLQNGTIKDINGNVINAARQQNALAEGKRAMWLDVGMQVEGRDDFARINRLF